MRNSAGHKMCVSPLSRVLEEKFTSLNIESYIREGCRKACSLHIGSIITVCC